MKNISEAPSMTFHPQGWGWNARTFLVQNRLQMYLMAGEGNKLADNTVVARNTSYKSLK